MDLNRRSTYEKFEKYSDLLSNKSVVYVYASNSNSAFNKLDKLMKFCSLKGIEPQNWFIDIGSSKDLSDKLNLINLLKYEEDVDIITCTSTDVSPFCTGDYFDIRRQLKENNIGVYDLDYENFYYERAPLSIWCMSNYCGI